MPKYSLYALRRHKIESIYDAGLNFWTVCHGNLTKARSGTEARNFGPQLVSDKH